MRADQGIGLPSGGDKGNLTLSGAVAQYGRGVGIIQMTAAQIISLFDLDHHPIRRADGGEDVPWNLTWRLRKEHRAKTAAIDVPQIAKSRRLRDNEAEFRRRLLAKGEPGCPEPRRSRWPSRKMGSRGTSR